MRWLFVLAIGCGDNSPAAPDAPITIDAAPACTALFTGNFSETSTSDTACAMFGDDGVFHLSIAATSLMAPYAIDLGVAAVPGDASSETTTMWSSMALRAIAHENCILAAGDQFVPHGDFTLHLDSVTPAHGSLSVDQPIHAQVFSNCGSPLVEHVEVAF